MKELKGAGQPGMAAPGAFGAPAATGRFGAPAAPAFGSPAAPAFGAAPAAPAFGAAAAQVPPPLVSLGPKAPAPPPPPPSTWSDSEFCSLFASSPPAGITDPLTNRVVPSPLVQIPALLMRGPLNYPAPPSRPQDGSYAVWYSVA